MDLDQHIHAERKSRILKRLCLVVGNRREDDEDAVRAPRARLVNLIRVEHEILAQSRKINGFARQFEILEGPLELRRIRQYGKARRAALFVGARQRRDVEILPDQPPARRGASDLRDQPVPPGGNRPSHRGNKAARCPNRWTGPRAPSPLLCPPPCPRPPARRPRSSAPRRATARSRRRATRAAAPRSPPA